MSCLGSQDIFTNSQKNCLGSVKILCFVDLKFSGMDQRKTTGDEIKNGIVINIKQENVDASNSEDTTEKKFKKRVGIIFGRNFSFLFRYVVYLY